MWKNDFLDFQNCDILFKTKWDQRLEGKNNAVIFTCVTEGQAHGANAIYGGRDKE